MQGLAEEYTRHLNEIRINKKTSIEAAMEELARVEKEITKSVDAICNGVPAKQVKDRMWELDAREKELEQKLANATGKPVVDLTGDLSALQAFATKTKTPSPYPKTTL